MMILWLVILAVIGFGIYYFFKNRQAAGGSEEAPLDLLKKRYAGGELTKEQYEQMKNELK